MVIVMNVSVKDVVFSYESARALDGVTLDIAGGEVVGLAGPNGSGKSTLLKHINRVLSPQGGVVLLDGEDVRELPRRDIARRVGVVPQMPGTAVPFRVWEAVLMGRVPHVGGFGGIGGEDVDVAGRALDLVGAGHLAERPVTELSGGEYQRVVIARALAQEPRVLLLDEPTLHLDVAHQLEVLELVRRLADERGFTVVMASHDLNLALRYSDRLVLLRSGRVHAAGRPAEVLTPENIRQVYRVEVRIVCGGPGGFPVVIPLFSSRRAERGVRRINRGEEDR